MQYDYDLMYSLQYLELCERFHVIYIKYLTFVNTQMVKIWNLST